MVLAGGPTDFFGLSMLHLKNKNAKPSVSAIAYCLEGFIGLLVSGTFLDFRDY